METKKVVFTRADVAARFDCMLEKDVIIHTKGYSGKISGINMAGAECILKDKNVSYLVEKAPAKKIEEKPKV